MKIEKKGTILIVTFPHDDRPIQQVVLTIDEAKKLRDALDSAIPKRKLYWYYNQESDMHQIFESNGEMELYPGAGSVWKLIGEA